MLGRGFWSDAEFVWKSYLYFFFFVYFSYLETFEFELNSCDWFMESFKFMFLIIYS